MSPTEVRRFSVSMVFMVIATVAIIFGFVLTNANYNQIRNESSTRTYVLCRSFAITRNGERQLIEFVTKPADLTGLDPVRLKVVQDLNTQRAKARADILAFLPKPPVCHR